jgi:site-specific recombinase XerD
MQKRRIALEDLDAAQALNLFSKAKWPACKRQHGDYMVKHFVRFLTEQGVKLRVVTSAKAENASEKLRREYEDYLRHERGLSEKSIRNLWYLILRFLKFRFGNETADLSKITPIDIASFMQQLHSRKEPYRVKTTATHLRWFFQFLFRSGKTKNNLSLGIPSVAQRWGQRLPRHLLPEQVEILLAAVRAETPLGRRNYAMLLLLARLGLRSPEVIAMQMDDIDWRSGEIVVRGKGKLFDRVPLPPDVGEALAAYIQRDRVTTSRAVFVSDRAPHLAFKCSETLNMILRDAFAKTGLKPPVPYVGSHILRHSLATNLVQRGASLDEIANVMRHRSRATTMGYAKMDVEGLRSIALPWPVKGGAK